MKRVDRQRWAAARTLRELGELTALWLEGRLASQPGHVPDCGPDDETLDLVPVLAGLNRAGWLTDVSQPGWGPGLGYDSATWSQRAGVGGLAEVCLADRITAAATKAELLVVRHAHASRRPRRDGVVVTTRNDRPYTWFGVRRTRRDLRDQYQECGDEALAEVGAAVQLTVIDPQWGRNDVLWPLLAQFIPLAATPRLLDPAPSARDVRSFGIPAPVPPTPAPPA